MFIENTLVSNFLFIRYMIEMIETAPDRTAASRFRR